MGKQDCNRDSVLSCLPIGRLKQTGMFTAGTAVPCGLFFLLPSSAGAEQVLGRMVATHLWLEGGQHLAHSADAELLRNNLLQILNHS